MSKIEIKYQKGKFFLEAVQLKNYMWRYQIKESYYAAPNLIKGYAHTEQEALQKLEESHAELERNETD